MWLAAATWTLSWLSLLSSGDGRTNPFSATIWFALCALPSALSVAVLVGLHRSGRPWPHAVAAAESIGILSAAVFTLWAWAGVLV